MELATDLLLIGKSINFVRSCCGDSEWVMDPATTATFESAGTLPDQRADVYVCVHLIANVCVGVSVWALRASV